MPRPAIKKRPVPRSGEGAVFNTFGKESGLGYNSMRGSGVAGGPGIGDVVPEAELGKAGALGMIGGTAINIGKGIHDLWKNRNRVPEETEEHRIVKQGKINVAKERNASLQDSRKRGGR